ncbi:MAG: hypothetical protein HY887_09030 [Deltaproteobacteria bacterium]|nr:hypothetical protein [Deltaproteobacteria bacterium]
MIFKGITTHIMMEAMLKSYGINEKTIFYGLDEVSTSNIIWKVSSFIKKAAPKFI